MKNIPDSGVIFTFEEGISTSHVCPKGQQPYFQNCVKLCYPNFYFFFIFEVDKSGALAPMYPPSKSYKVGWVVKEEKEEKLLFNSPANQKLTINN